MTEKMKPSGIVWIGDIPLEWESTKIKYCVHTIGSGTTPDSGNPAYYDDGVFPWIQSGDLYGKSMIWDTEKRLTKSAITDFPALSWYEKDFVVIAMYGASVGNVAISKIDSYTNQACCVIKPRKDSDLRFFYYYLSAAQEDMLQKAFGGTQPNISQVIIKNLSYLNVPTKEQTQIADFLDAQCAKIDSVIADIEKQIETLQKYKKSLITETVTKGCTAGSKTKTVRLDFADEINEAWIETRVKYLCSMYSGDNLTSSDIEPEGDYPVYGGNGLRGFYAAYTNDGEHVLIGRQGALCGNVHLVSGKFWATDHAVVTYPYEGTCNGYLFYLFSAMNLNQYSQTAAQPGLAVAAIQNLSTCIPPTTEIQQEIAKYLDEKCGKIDSIIEAKRKQLEIMEEHKKSLIYEYVTGKKRVTEVN